MSWNTNAGT